MLSELGVGAANVLTFEHSMSGFHTARSAGLATVVVMTDQLRGYEFTAPPRYSTAMTGPIHCRRPAVGACTNAGGSAPVG